VGWTMSASELWVAAQRAMPSWARGRMNATVIMISQGAMALVGAFYILAKPLVSDQGLKEQNGVATRQLPVARPKAETEPQERLWKVWAEAASPWLSGFEFIAFLFFGALALGGLAYCFSELFHLLNSGALDETVRALLTR
jgi:hypothetical protein